MPIDITRIKVSKNTQAQQPAVTDPVKKEENEKKDVEKQLQGGLRGNKANQETAKENYIKYFEEEIGLKHSKAKKYAKLGVENAIAKEKVENTTVYTDKAEYKEAKQEHKDNKYENITYVRNNKVRELVEKEPQRYSDDGKFSSDKYKERVATFTGSDYKQNLDERNVMAKKNDITKNAAKKAAKYGGFETEKDLTWLKRAGLTAGGAALGSPLGAGVGYAVTGATIVNAILNQMMTVTYTDTGKVEQYKQTTTERQEISNKANGAKTGAYAGAAGGAIGAGFASAFTKDNGGKDIFNGINIRAFVEEGTTGVRGKENEKILSKGIDILKQKGYNTDDIVKCVQVGVAEMTNGKANERELIGFVEAAKLMPQKPEEKKKDCEEKKVELKPDLIKPEGTEIKLQPLQVEPKNLGDLDIKKIVEEKTVSENISEYRPAKGEYWSSIVAAKYGLSAGELKEAVGELKKVNGIVDRNANTQPTIMRLPNELTVNGKKYKLNLDEKPATTDKFDPNFKPAAYTEGKKTTTTTDEYYEGTITNSDGSKQKIKSRNLNEILDAAKKANVPTDKLNNGVNKVIETK